LHLTGLFIKKFLLLHSAKPNSCMVFFPECTKRQTSYLLCERRMGTVVQVSGKICSILALSSQKC